VTDESTRCADHPFVAIRRRRVLLRWPESRRGSRRAYPAHPNRPVVDWPTAIDSHSVVSLLRGPSPDRQKNTRRGAWRGRWCGIRPQRHPGARRHAADRPQDALRLRAIQHRVGRGPAGRSPQTGWRHVAAAADPQAQLASPSSIMATCSWPGFVLESDGQLMIPLCCRRSAVLHQNRNRGPNSTLAEPMVRSVFTLQTDP
jgi:hypothetical protein